MSEATAIQAVSRAIGAVVDIVEVRDPSDGTSSLAIRYSAGHSRWLSTCRFQDPAQAHIAGIAISDFSGARFSA
ncbi:hypothetical protein [Bradyrhizobium sp. JYMT SZCCT0428]|uniref:hypothetical protein n=1 Tax=Bradyrhizobium sp. JYMT SZCCT0428 TaxID=2807673 RepID=UPI001BA71904|nr:hypothetical protein [Bradyrhizobium sp. JYMT SZCCT0428]MBR1149348.1 hypothetical protein [Bradyrhizobium sp. JYMT SZCCT0428]